MARIGVMKPGVLGVLVPVLGVEIEPLLVGKSWAGFEAVATVPGVPSGAIRSEWSNSIEHEATSVVSQAVESNRPLKAP